MIVIVIHNSLQNLALGITFAILGHLILANLVLEDTVERIYRANNYGDIPRGVFLIRGENVVLLGEIVSQPATNNKRTTVHNIAHLRNVCGAGL